MKNVLLITSGHISSNPRLIKEATWLSENGYSISIVSLRTLRNNSVLDQHILDNNPTWRFYPIDLFSMGQFKRLYFGLKVKLFSTLFLFIKSDYLLYNVVSRYDSLLEKVIKKINADLIIGHNLAALPCSYKHAKRLTIPFGFDIEDAYSVQHGLTWESGNSLFQELERRVLPKARYLTAASPLIADLYFEKYNLNKRPDCINNVFNRNPSSLKFISEKADNNAISFYWFSQTIGLDRGLRDFIIAFDEIENLNWELHLRGNSTSAVQFTLTSLAKNESTKHRIFFHNQVDEELLFSLTSSHDIGLASEVASSLNRDICLTNKIFYYMTCCIGIIYSQTLAQKNLMEQFPSAAVGYKSGNIRELKIILESILNDPIRISTMKNESGKLYQTRFNWTFESAIFGNIITKINAGSE